jgi:hypothetical protein
MKRFRLSTLMLLIVIAALCFALVDQWMRKVERDRQLQDAAEQKIAKLKASLLQLQANLR